MNEVKRQGIGFRSVQWDDREYIIMDHENNIIAKGISTPENAACLAAAPALLEVAEETLNMLTRISTLLNGSPTADDIQTAYNLAYPGRIRTAVAQAKGEEV